MALVLLVKAYKKQLERKYTVETDTFRPNE